MSKVFELEIDCSNDAFADDARLELAMILREYAGDMETFGLQPERGLYDSNGNRVGVVRYK